MERLSDLERATLGVLAVRGPSTAYAVRRQYEASRSSHWSGSSGAIYPLLRRLESKGLIASEPTATGRRKGRLYSMTRAGDAAFRAWLRSPVDPDEARLTYDRIRTRTYFLAALTPDERRTFLLDAERRLVDEVTETERAIEEDTEERFERLAALGGLRVLEARLAWVREVLQGMDEDGT